MWKRSLLWVITLLWAIGIFCFSAQPATQSSKLSSKITKQIVRCLSDTNTPESHIEKVARQVEHTIRKIAHFGLFMVLGVLVFFLCRTYRVCFRIPGDVSWGITTLYALSDEIHQYFVPGRSCQITDVLIDSLGAVVGILFAAAVNLMYKKMIKKC